MLQQIEQPLGPVGLQQVVIEAGEGGRHAIAELARPGQRDQSCRR